MTLNELQDIIDKQLDGCKHKIRCSYKGLDTKIAVINQNEHQTVFIYFCDTIVIAIGEKMTSNELKDILQQLLGENNIKTAINSNQLKLSMFVENVKGHWNTWELNKEDWLDYFERTRARGSEKEKQWCFKLRMIFDVLNDLDITIYPRLR